MNGWLAHRILRLYPLAYRRRYEDEMRALLEDQPPRTSTVLDLLRGALLAHLRPADAPAGAVGPADRVRLSASAVLMCWVFFAAAGFGFYKTTEDYPYSHAGQVHPILRDAHLAVQVVAVIASATVLIGALPLIAAALAQARHDRGLRRTVALALLPLIVFVAFSAVLIAIGHAHTANHGTIGGYGAAVAWVAWGIVGIASAVTCVLACRRAVFAVHVPPAYLRTAFACGALVTVAMLVIAGATALYAITLHFDAAGLAAAPNGPFQILSTIASLIVQLLVMIVAGGLAAVAIGRGSAAAADLHEHAESG